MTKNKDAKVLESIFENSLKDFRQYSAHKAESPKVSQQYRNWVLQAHEFTRLKDEAAAAEIIRAAVTVDKEDSQLLEKATRAIEQEIRAAIWCGERGVALTKTDDKGKEKPISARAARQAYEKAHPTDKAAIKAYEDKYAMDVETITPEIIAEGHEILALVMSEKAKKESGRIESASDALRFVDTLSKVHSDDALVLIQKAIAQYVGAKKRAAKKQKEAESKAKKESPESFATTMAG